MTKEVTWLVCVTMDMDHVEGATISNCTVCDTQIWIAPSSATLMVNEPFMKPICVTCAMSRIKDDPDPCMKPITEEQIKEIIEHYARNK